jgi:hypothetical protein
MKKQIRFMIMVFIVAAVAVGWMGSAVLAQDQPPAGAKQKAPEGAQKMEAKKEILDGKKFMGEMGATGQTTGDKETIVFHSGMFHSMACDAKGFKPAPYTATKEGDAISFTATCTSPTAGKLDWKGTVKGEELDATATLTQEGKEPVTMWAKGKGGAPMHKGKMKEKGMPTGGK